MLRIKINKDIEEYSEGMFIGLNIKEIGNFLIMAAVSVMLVFLWSRVVPIIAALYLSAPVNGGACEIYAGIYGAEKRDRIFVNGET